MDIEKTRPLYSPDKKFKLVRPVANLPTGMVGGWMAESRADGSLHLVKRVGTHTTRREVFTQIERRQGWAQVRSIEERDGFTYIVRDWIDGAPLARLLGISECLWSESTARHVLSEVCRHLSPLHSAGFGHGQIHANNIIATDSGIVLTDPFPGRLLDFNSDARLTQLSLLVGDPYFLAPEQFREKVITPASDVYALGCLLYYGLTGRPPFRGTNPVLICCQHLSTMPPPLAEQRPDVSSALIQIIEIALSKTPTVRYSDAGEMAKAMGSDHGQAAGLQKLLLEYGDAERSEVKSALPRTSDPDATMSGDLCKPQLLSRESVERALHISADKELTEEEREALLADTAPLLEYGKSIPIAGSDSLSSAKTQAISRSDLNAALADMGKAKPRQIQLEKTNVLSREEILQALNRPKGQPLDAPGASVPDPEEPEGEFWQPFAWIEGDVAEEAAVAPPPPAPPAPAAPAAAPQPAPDATHANAVVNLAPLVAGSAAHGRDAAAMEALLAEVRKTRESFRQFVNIVVSLMVLVFGLLGVIAYLALR